jgi:FKBP-type peptidyl-prolyl cis-trans isomerase FklB
MLAGFIAGAKNDTTIMKKEAANLYQQVQGQRITERLLEARYAENKEAGEKFLAENKTKEGVVTTESGLQYKIIKEGKGAIPTATDRVSVNYKGTLIDGTEFDSSYKNNKPAVFGAGQVIKGWTEALTMMPVGSKWELYIPQDLAYGPRETGQIKPFSTLIFEVELVGIEK